jgi:hypothetical protein
MFIKINEKFYNFNNVLEYYLKDNVLTLYFIGGTSTIIHDVSLDLKELLTKKIIYEC